MLAFCLTHGKIYLSEDFHAKLLKGCLLYFFFLLGLTLWVYVNRVQEGLAWQERMSGCPLDRNQGFLSHL